MLRWNIKTESSSITPALLDEQAHSSNAYASVSSEGRTEPFRASFLCKLLIHRHTHTLKHAYTQGQHIPQENSVNHHSFGKSSLTSIYIKFRKAMIFLCSAVKELHDPSH